MGLRCRERLRRTIGRLAVGDVLFVGCPCSARAPCHAVHRNVTPTNGSRGPLPVEAEFDKRCACRMQCDHRAKWAGRRVSDAAANNSGGVPTDTLDAAFLRSASHAAIKTDGGAGGLGPDCLRLAMASNDDDAA